MSSKQSVLNVSITEAQALFLGRKMAAEKRRLKAAGLTVPPNFQDLFLQGLLDFWMHVDRREKDARKP